MANTSSQEVLTISELKRAASAKLDKTAREYFNEGAMDMITLRDNEHAFDKYKIRQRILVDVASVDTRITMLGSEIALPLAFAPAAMHGLAHHEAEKGTSRAAAAKSIPMGLSTYATTSLEDVIEEKGESSTPYMFQLSVTKDRSVPLDLMKRAEKAGYRALILTVDAPVLGRRLNETRNKLTLPDNLCLPNLGGVRSHHNPGRDASNSWESIIPWVKSHTMLEVWLKGIYCSEDVLLAIKYGLDGIIVSNHGGRQLDGAAATIDVLPECAEAAKGRIKIGIDGGIRRGSDIFKALALGADCCFVGRIPIWGLAYNGEEGVKLAVDILEQELRTTMALAGCSSIKEISRHHLSILGTNGILSRL
ncbi:Oxidase FUB9 [Colletotrichum fructicola]|uniref:Oxidase FUB9 n=2 Tax=Colletotrichum gloeosporioides species complex TaxID=2707338 RepID=L2GBU6_COLFN|nr:Oxidase [Colletotrichum fructicola]KAF4483045.1 Oxidase FUB9 [Colletotrichum fructicola Nara gc5]KAK1856071.1 fmn-dependent dehydrogenase family protein [Colletotrichum chrysophilum]KAE9574132.1 Oxidase [Colletotrichum fructicola]KAF4420656.1 Oxidase FUB9 [Colletotrichum fructicola]KAF4887895.1 Oxidase FUB9 [Colletotrichum fructicola]